MFDNLFINAWGGYTAPTGLQDYSKTLATHKKIIDKGMSFCVFPEGGISHDGSVRPARGGIAYLAEYNKCPIIPVGCSGLYGISVKDFFTRKRHVVISFGKAITQEELKNNVMHSKKEEGNVYKEEAEYVVGIMRDLVKNRL